MKGGGIRIGTSGWHYSHWKGTFYPPGTRAAGFLAYYASRFSTVEINNSFYRLPERATLESWARAVPEGFSFAAKASRYITEAKKLKDPGGPLARFFERITALGGRLGPILFQLPPHWRADAGRLREFLLQLPVGFRYAFEFREPSWYREEVYGLLADHGCALCVTDYGGRLSPVRVTTGFTYVRLHGPGRYSRDELGVWARRFAVWRRGGTGVYLYFNNDREGFAAENAAELREMTAERRAAAR